MENLIHKFKLSISVIKTVEKTVKIYCIGTGHEVPFGSKNIDSVQIYGFVWHFFYE